MHRSDEFLTLLEQIDSTVPDDLTVQRIRDNYATHKTPTVKRWLEKHDRFSLHFTPVSGS